MVRWLHRVVTGAINRLVEQYRRAPDRGDESVNKILWAGAIVVVVATVVPIFRDEIVNAFNALTVTLGLSP